MRIMLICTSLFEYKVGVSYFEVFLVHSGRHVLEYKVHLAVVVSEPRRCLIRASEPGYVAIAFRRQQRWSCRNAEVRYCIRTGCSRYFLLFLKDYLCAPVAFRQLPPCSHYKAEKGGFTTGLFEWKTLHSRLFVHSKVLCVDQFIACWIRNCLAASQELIMLMPKERT